jgi:hypothetical protein
MVKIEMIDTEQKSQVKRFYRMPFSLYKDTPQWVPPLYSDVAYALNKNKYPFYEHSEADFFIASRDGNDVGRVAAIEQRMFNEYHKTKKAQFYFFETIDDLEVAGSLIDTVSDWARQRGLDAIIGPKGLSVLDGYGILTEGFEHRQLMNMVNYNLPYYPTIIESLGFEPENNFLSCYLELSKFHLPERVHKIAERVLERGTLSVKKFQNKKELIAYAQKIGQAYNKAFVNNWEYAPLTEREVQLVLDNIMAIANPKLIKIILHGEDVVGFLLGFPDVSGGLQHANGNLFPFGIVHILRDLKKAKLIAFNGAGILPEFQGIGGNALLYSEMDKTLKEFHFDSVDMTQIAETAEQMRSDLANLGGIPYRNHRVYHKSI